MDMDGIRTFIIGLVLVSLIGGAGAIALSEFQSDEKGKHTTATVEESVSVTGGAGGLLYGGLYIGGGYTCVNNTGGTDNTMTGIHCNITSGGGVIVNADNFSDNIALINYTYYTPNAQFNITLSGLEGTNNATGYFGTAGTIAGVALLLTIVIGAFYFVTKTNQQ